MIKIVALQLSCLHLVIMIKLHGYLGNPANIHTPTFCTYLNLQLTSVSFLSRNERLQEWLLQLQVMHLGIISYKQLPIDEAVHFACLDKAQIIVNLQSSCAKQLWSVSINAWVYHIASYAWFKGNLHPDFSHVRLPACLYQRGSAEHT